MPISIPRKYPSASLYVELLNRHIDVSGLPVTIIVHSAFSPDEATVAVKVISPFVRALIFPFESTVATFSFETDQRISSSDAFSPDSRYVTLAL